MRIRFVVLLSILVPSAAAAQTVSQDALLNASARALDLLVKQSPVFVKSGGCNSCHNQMLPAAAQAFARSRGIVTGETIMQLPPEASEATTERYVEYSIGGGGGVSALGFELFAAAMDHKPADARIRAKLYFIKGMQQPEGHWLGGGSRPPLTFDDFTTTAYMIHALRTYAAPAEAADTKARVDRARTWLLNATPDRTQERAFQALGLVWSHADEAAIAEVVKSLQASQRTDGGWSQLPALESDAYATGIALFALHEARMPSTHQTYRAGVKYLLSTQAADGTWHVKTRALPFQPYFESGYPYGHDQWISAAAAAYATLALSSAVDVSEAAAR